MKTSDAVGTRMGEEGAAGLALFLRRGTVGQLEQLILKGINAIAVQKAELLPSGI